MSSRNTFVMPEVRKEGTCCPTVGKLTKPQPKDKPVT